MIFLLILGGLAAAGLLAVLGTLSSGRLIIDNICDISRARQPVTFFVVLAGATLVFGGLFYLCVASFWITLSGGNT